jgi:uncharacterized protein (DUF1697 family)
VASKYVAFVRAVNVGGRNKLPNNALAAIFERAGCRDVETYIQSGNVVFSASATVRKRLACVVENAIAVEHGFSPTVLLRSAEALSAIALTRPFPGADPKHLHFAFLSAAPTARAIAALDGARFAPDAFAVHGDTIYLHCPNGIGKSKLTSAYFDSKLGVVSTVRNHNTLLALCERSR